MPIMPTYLTGWVADLRKRVRFIPADAIVTTCSDPLVLVFNDHGHFFAPNLQPGRTYEFIARNGAMSKRFSFTPRRGHNEVEVEVRTKPARALKVAKPSSQRQARA